MDEAERREPFLRHQAEWADLAAGAKQAYASAESRAGTLGGDADLLLKRAMQGAKHQLAEWRETFAANPLTALSRSFSAFKAAAVLENARFIFSSIHYQPGGSIERVLSARPQPCGGTPPVPPDPGVTQKLMQTLQEAAYERLRREIKELVERHEGGAAGPY
jgi:hypothetical protein